MPNVSFELDDETFGVLSEKAKELDVAIEVLMSDISKIHAELIKSGADVTDENSLLEAALQIYEKKTD